MSQSCRPLKSHIRRSPETIFGVDQIFGNFRRCGLTQVALPGQIMPWLQQPLVLGHLIYETAEGTMIRMGLNPVKRILEEDILRSLKEQLFDMGIATSPAQYRTLHTTQSGSARADREDYMWLTFALSKPTALAKVPHKPDISVHAPDYGRKLSLTKRLRSSHSVWPIRQMDNEHKFKTIQNGKL